MRPEDAAAACAVSAEAGERFRTIAEPRIASCADDPPFTVGELNIYVDGGRAWVATQDDTVIGFAIVDIVDGRTHIEEIDVAPRASGRGHGSRLVDEVARWARSTGSDALTLTTFRDVPWNAPWYVRRGFRVLGEAELTPELRRLRDEENERGLPAELRVVMRLDVADRSPCDD
jgi:ribosomal protein S18 acetylase RimI-like enzyme